MKNAKKTALAAAVALGLTAASAAGTANAYFTTYATARGGHTIHLGHQSRVREEFSRWTKHISLENTGEKEAYVRVKVFAGAIYGLEYAGNGKWSTGEDGWTVSFRGNGLESNFKTADINDAVYNLQPGDSIAITVAQENGGGKSTDWWMTNRVLRSLEDTQEAASGGSYTYTLIYENPEGTEQVLYTSDTVGGEKEGESGLKEATDSLEEYFFLDALAAGEKGHIRLTVALDGEIQGNSYQDSLADLQMNFAVEETSGPRLVPTDEGENPDPTPVPGTPGGRGTGRPPKTSDESDIFPYVGLSLVSGIGLLVTALYSLKRSGREEKET